MMKRRLWLEKEDRVWRQLVRWNSARELLFMVQGQGGVEDYIYGVAQSCPDIQEARWFLNIVGDVQQLDRDNLRTALRLASTDDLHARTFLALREKNYRMLERCALDEDPLSQGHIPDTLYFGNRQIAKHWLTRSVAGGYSEAFAKMASLHQGREADGETLNYLLAAIEAGSSDGMRLYSEYITGPERVYWLCQAWIGQLKRPQYIACELDNWYEEFVQGRQIHEGFIYGYTVSRLNREEFAMVKRIFGDDNDPHNIACCRALNLYNHMCDNTKRAVYAWSLIGKRLGVVKDIRIVIAKLIWYTRDQPVWYTGLV